MSDEKILEISYKKPSYFGELFDRHYGRFMLTAQKTLRSKADAEDVVQEVFIRIYKYGKKFPKNGGKFRPWSNTILKNCIADQINKYKNSTVALTDEMASKLASPDLMGTETYLKENKNRSYVQFVLNKIGGVTAEVVNMRYILGKPFKEIAKALKIKSGAARVRVHRSKKIFIREYKQLSNKFQ